MTRPTTVALALGSGGARGYAHIGVIEVLVERGYEIVSVAGSSMGALIGGLHAAGRLNDYAEWARGLGQFEVLRLLDLSFKAPGAIRAEKIFAIVRELLGDLAIEDLPIPFTAVATDLLARREVWFQRGPLEIAIRASVAIPSIVTPVVLNGRLLADGGLMNPVPIAPTAAVGADLILAVSLNADQPVGSDVGGMDDSSAIPARESSEAQAAEEWADRMRRTAARLLDRDVVRAVIGRFSSDDGPEESALPGEAELLPAGLGKFDVMNLAYDAMQTVLTRYRFAGYPPDVLVGIPKDACRTLDFHRAAEMIETGRQAATAALDGISNNRARTEDQGVRTDTEPATSERD